jgi:hypothetical protein
VDIWFDMEGDPFANNGAGLEYMFGYLFKKGSQFEFDTFDARDKVEEKLAFIDFINYVFERRNEYPQMHVYHYASYEVSAMLRLAQRHGVLEFEVDKLVRWLVRKFLEKRLGTINKLAWVDVRTGTLFTTATATAALTWTERTNAWAVATWTCRTVTIG